MTPDGDGVPVTIGQRISCDGHFATVKYVGEVPPSKGLWLGVEWDDPNRGRHDGLHAGVQYFKSSHPTAGSFVRPAKVSFGQSLPSELKARYGIGDENSSGVDLEVLKEVQKSTNAPFVEMVGFSKISEKQSRFQDLRVVCLQGQNVSSSGEDGEIASLCPSVEQLDLSSTLISSWSVIAKITRQLQKLWQLNISNNRVEVPVSCEACQMKESFQQLQELIMKQLNYTWSDVLTCAQMWPHILSLNVAKNKIECLEIPPLGLLDRLTELHLDQNPVSDWDEINKLGKLQSLQTLALTETPIRRIHFPGEKTTTLFQTLKALYISRTLIDNWESFNELNKLTALIELRSQDIPLIMQLEELRGKGTQMIVARIGNLQMLNRFQLNVVERNGAEYDYMKRYGKEWLNAKKTEKEAEFLKAHPRYKFLIEKHGEIDKDEVEEKLWTLKSRIIKVNIVSSNHPDRPPLCKSVPSDMSVQKLIGLVQKLYRMEKTVPSLYAVSAKTPDMEVKLDKELQGLGYFSVENGDTISVRW